MTQRLEVLMAMVSHAPGVVAPSDMMDGCTRGSRWNRVSMMNFEEAAQAQERTLRILPGFKRTYQMDPARRKVHCAKFR